MALISVITPTYNRARLIPDLVKSLKSQSFKDWELIIVDDGSTDGTEVVAMSFTDNQIKYLKKNNTGAAHSRNIGAESAAGEYLVFLDSDDLVCKDWLFEISHKLDNNKIDIVCVGVQFENLDGTIKVDLPNSHSKLFPGTHFQLYAGAFAISKKLFFDLGAYDTSLAARQHTDLWIRIFNNATNRNPSIVCIYKPLVRIIEHHGERIRKNPKAVYIAAIQLISKHKSLFDNSHQALFNYYVLIGTNALGAGEKSVGRNYLYKAFRLNPFHLKNNIRVILSLFSLIGINSWESKFKTK